jgi:hypothetical protein
VKYDWEKNYGEDDDDGEGEDEGHVENSGITSPQSSDWV